MKAPLTYFTLLRIVPNPAAGEAVVVGLVAFDGQRHWYRVSERKLRLAQQLAPGTGEAIRLAVGQIDRQIAADAAAREQGRDGLTYARWQYLSQASHGLLRFSAPAPLAFFAGDDEERVIGQLFGEWVDPLAQGERQKPGRRALPKEFKARVKQLVTRVAPLVHTSLEVTVEDLPRLYFDFPLDCIGKNGAFTAAHTLSVSRHPVATLERHLAQYDFLAQALFDKFSPRDPLESRFYIITEEPEKHDTDKYKFWQSIQQKPLFVPIAPEAVGEIADRIEKTKAHTFLGR